MSIQNKLFLVLILFGTLLVGSVVALMQWSIDRGMVEYVNQKEINALQSLREQLVSSYQYDGSWDDFYRADHKFSRLIKQHLQNTEFSPPPLRPPNRRGEPPFLQRRNGQPPHELERPNRRNEALRANDSNRGEQANRVNQKNEVARRPVKMEHQVSYALLDVNKNLIVGHYPQEREYQFTPLTLENKTIGFMAVSKRNRLTNGFEFDFIEQQKDHLWFIAIGILLIVLLVTLPFAKHLIAPIKALAQGMHQLTQGKYQSHLTTTRKDEFAALTRDFNELATTLFENETARKRWLANISHELRTPVTILKGELEAIIDGVRDLSMDHIHSAHQEVSHLQRLIADLQALTSADIGGMSYRKASINLTDFLSQECKKLTGYLANAGFHLDTEISEKAQNVMVFADKTRLCQLFENLVDNCIKYSATGKNVRFSVDVDVDDFVENTAKHVNIVIEDDGIGVEHQHLANLFEHLYRVEDSRNRKTGGSGLGLSICAHIVQAHQGEIFADKSSLGGLAIHISIPIQG